MTRWQWLIVWALVSFPLSILVGKCIYKMRGGDLEED